MKKTYETMIHNQLEEQDLMIPLHFFEETTSTNDVAKEMIQSNAFHGTTIVACKQNAGRGTYGRSFLSEVGGIYLSLMIHTREWQFKETQLTTIFVAVAVRWAVNDVLGIQLDLKWVNDLFLRGKKVGGILTEHVFGGDWMVIGIGLNISPLPRDFPDELKQIATTLGVDDPNHSIKAQLIGAIMNKILKPSQLSDKGQVLDHYKKGLFILNRHVWITYQNEEFEVLVQGVDQLGRLVVQTSCGEMLHLQTGDVRLDKSVYYGAK